MNLPLAIGADWGLPANYAVHGRSIDAHFRWILAITVVVLIATHLVLLTFLIRYRRRSASTAHYTHGSRRIEIIWTALPLVILLAMATASKAVWDNFRDSPALTDPGRSRVLVIGQQFKWNIIYPGPDGVFGRYLVFPKPTDAAWPIGEDGQPTTFAAVPGPAALPADQAVAAINRYIDTVNPLGKDFTDPAGKDDDYQSALARTLYVPVNRPVEIDVQSKDVIHDFFLPNFRAQIYAVPGSTGKFAFIPTTTTASLEAASRRLYSVDELPDVLSKPGNSELTIDINEQSPGAVHDKFGWRYVVKPAVKKPLTIVRDQMPFPPNAAEQLKAAGIKQVTAHRPAYLDIVCAQLCGLGHYTMQGRIVVLSQQEFDQKFPAAPYANGW